MRTSRAWRSFQRVIASMHRWHPNRSRHKWIDEKDDQNVEWVFIDGRPVKRNGKLVGVDPDAIVKNGQAAANRIRRFLFP